LEVKSGVKMDV